ncbi:putative dehydrogenase [Terracoccus luteus]|uniref:Putative dehydrogenase n=1 Tax=Terracoccus luteus TaxID=53356 RepID=A0A495XYV3_9MICO|nr:Gfo/Idh/MocA family oxidoreductase [Terracoccus luteus]RKT78499.1 putative dehydrogenase [Terracoccus luteus]
MSFRVAVVGAGYWGPNLVRNFRASPEWELVAVCDLDADRARVVAGDPRVDVETDVGRLLARDDVDAVAIATPANSHRRLALAALESGRHVLVEKPLATSSAEGLEMVEAARDRGLVLMCDHTYCYTPVVQRIRDIVASGELGDVLFVDSVRINLGLVQPDVDVLWDLAPHDLSILDFILPGGLVPQGVAAHGADPIGAGRACVGYLTMPLAGGAMAHVHVNWLSPTKIRHMVVGGSRRTLVWDDLNPQQRLSVYDRGVDLDTASRSDDLSDRRAAGISYRLGDMYAPSLPEVEALGSMVREFASAIKEQRPSVTDGSGGLRVLRVLEASTTSLGDGGRMVEVVTDQAPDPANDRTSERQSGRTARQNGPQQTHQPTDQQQEVLV